MADGSLLLLGLKGPQLTSEEAQRFRQLQPAGYILFTRNIESAGDGDRGLQQGGQRRLTLLLALGDPHQGHRPFPALGCRLGRPR